MSGHKPDCRCHWCWEALTTEVKRLEKDNEDLEYANNFCGRSIETLTAEVQRLEDAMRSIQAVTSDVAVVDITDEALCPDSDSGSPLRDVASQRVGDHVDLHRRATADSSPEPCDHEYGFPQHSGSVGSVWTCNKCQHTRFSEPVEKGQQS